MQAAVEVLTVDDTGRGWPAARWAQARVEVAVRGPAATPEVLADIDQVLGWMSQVTGTRFVRTDAPRAPFQVVLAAGRAPAGTIRQTGHRIVTASVGWDPTHPHADRWTWEELLQMAGPAGDHGPAGTLLSTDQTARAPTAFDRWVLHTLYQVPDHQLGADALREALAASLADHVGPGADGPML